MNKQHYAEKRKALMIYLFDLAVNKGISQDAIAESTGFLKSNISRMKKGLYSPTLDNLMAVADAVGYDVAFANKILNEHVSDEHIQPKFLLSIDPKNNELYLLHRHFPACLMHIKQETPVRFIIQDLYDDVENPADILNMPFVDEAKEYWKNYASNLFNKN